MPLENSTRRASGEREERLDMKKSIGDRLFDTVNHTLLVFLSLCFVLPFIFIVTASIVSEAEFIEKAGFVFFPSRIDLTAYKIVLSSGSVVLSGYKITIVRTLAGTFLNLLFTTTLAYGLSKKRLLGRNFMLTVVFITMFFGGGLIPTYILVDSLHMTNKLWSLIIPGLINAWYMIIMKNFFSAFSPDIEESAIIDGANDAVVFLRIILPLSIPTIATIGLFYAIGHWNSWFDAVIYIRDTKIKPLALILRGIVIQNSMSEISGSAAFKNSISRPPQEAVRAASIIVSIGPIIAVYPFVQKYFVKGIMIGAVKG